MNFKFEAVTVVNNKIRFFYFYYNQTNAQLIS